MVPRTAHTQYLWVSGNPCFCELPPKSSCATGDARKVRTRPTAPEAVAASSTRLAKIRLLAVCAGCGGVARRGMLLLFFSRRNCLLALCHPLVGRLRVGVARGVGIGALPGEGVMQPLGEEPTVERDLSTMVPGDVVEALAQGPGEATWRLHSCRRDVHHDLRQPLWHGGRRSDPALHLAENSLALVDATDGVEARGCEAIVGAAHVIRDEHPKVLWVPLVQRAELPQVADTLRELPVLIRLATVEIRKWHAARASLLQLQERPFHRAALLVLPAAVGVLDVLNDAPGVLERIILGTREETTLGLS